MFKFEHVKTLPLPPPPPPRINSKKKPHIIQLIFGPENNKWQGKLLGLSSEGDVYVLVNGVWEIIQTDN